MCVARLAVVVMRVRDVGAGHRNALLLHCHDVRKRNCGRHSIKPREAWLIERISDGISEQVGHRRPSRKDGVDFLSTKQRFETGVTVRFIWQEIIVTGCAESGTLGTVNRKANEVSL